MIFYCINSIYYFYNLVNFTKKFEEQYSIGNRKFENYTTFYNSKKLFALSISKIYIQSLYDFFTLLISIL